MDAPPLGYEAFPTGDDRVRDLVLRRLPRFGVRCALSHAIEHNRVDLLDEVAAFGGVDALPEADQLTLAQLAWRTGHLGIIRWCDARLARPTPAAAFFAAYRSMSLAAVRLAVELRGATPADARAATEKGPWQGGDAPLAWLCMECTPMLLVSGGACDELPLPAENVFRVEGQAFARQHGWPSHIGRDDYGRISNHCRQILLHWLLKFADYTRAELAGTTVDKYVDWDFDDGSREQTACVPEEGGAAAN